MNINACYPVICTDKINATKEFYTTFFDFTTTFEADWYVSLKSRLNPNYELALLDFRHASLPDNFKEPTRGLLINFEVPDVDHVYEQLKAQKLQVVLDLKSEEWGQRHFIIQDPNGILLDIIQNIAPSDEFAEQYTT